MTAGDKNLIALKRLNPTTNNQLLELPLNVVVDVVKKKKDE
jgi:hypothetical protein